MRLALLLAACGGDPVAAPGPGGGGGVAVDSGEDECADAVALTWDGWADGFFATWCRSCHSATAPDRHGAPAGVDFDGGDEVMAQAARVRARVLDDGSMPLGGGVPTAELEALDRWLRCGTADGGGTPEVDPEPVEPSFDRAALAAALDAALAGGLPQIDDIHEAYLGFFAWGDGRCPGHDDYIDDIHLYGCEASSGAWFSGVSEHVVSETEVDGDRYGSWFLFGDLLFVDPAGGVLEAGGELTFDATRAADGRLSRATRHLGSWSYTGGGGARARGVSGLLDQTLTRDGGDTLVVEGAVGFDGVSLRFDALTLSPGCPDGATGALSLRDPVAGWYRVDLGEGCSACGPAVFEGRDAIGEVCPDLSALRAQATAELDALGGEAR